MTDKIRWGTERRLEFIEFRLFWEGGVNRSDITEKFGVSTPQASSDLSLYQQKAPNNVTYNAREKRYVPTDEFQPQFLELSADSYLSELRLEAEGSRRIVDSWIQTIPSTDSMPMPHRRVKPTVLREMLAVIKEQRSVEIHYHSMNAQRPERTWRRISPHAFGFDGMRWHVRAYCHDSGVFKDFLLSRCDALRNVEDPASSADEDKHWNETVEVLLEPNPRLSPGQRLAIAEDYEMSGGESRLRVRRALLYYLNKRLRLDFDLAKDEPAENPLHLINREEFYREMKVAQSAKRTDIAPSP